MIRNQAMRSSVAMDNAMEGDGENSLSSHESQDAQSSDYEPPDAKSQEPENESDYFSAEEEVEAGDYSFQRANNPELTARKSEFYKDVDEALKKLDQEHNTNSIVTDEYFDTIVKVLLALETADDKKRVAIMKSHPNKVAYKWVKQYDLMVVQSSQILIYKQEEGSPLDLCQQVVKYSNLFDAICEIHDLQSGNDHPKAKTLYKRICAKYGKCIPRWVCKIFPKHCPVCVKGKTRKKAKAGHQPLLTRGMNVRAQIDLIDYQSMPDGLFNYVLVYQDHGIKFCQLRPLRNRTHNAVAVELINIFCIFGPPSILQADNGKEFSHGAGKSRQVVLDDEVSKSYEMFSYTV